MGERYYDPKGSIFFSEDPIGFAGGDANLKRYVENSPLIWIDPEGLKRIGRPKPGIKNKKAEEAFENARKLMKPHNFGGDWTFDFYKFRCKKYSCLICRQKDSKASEPTPCHKNEECHWEDVIPPFIATPEYMKNCVCIEKERLFNTY